MSLKNIVIIGAGFAGLSALKTLGNRRVLKDYKIILIDKRDDSEFLPILPDIISGKVDEGCLKTDILRFAKKNKTDFLKDEVKRVDFEKKEVIFENGKINYEYLIIATGSETNFFGSDVLAKNCYKLDNISDGLRIRESLLDKIQKKEKINALIIGGGYTGIEIATNVRLLLSKTSSSGEVRIVEKGKDILSMLPASLSSNIKKKLLANGIEIINEDSLREYDGFTAILESGREEKDVLCIWAPGVKPTEPVISSPFNKERQRILVNEYLQPKNSSEKTVFIAGDAAAFLDSGLKPIRMAIMFSIEEGKITAKNVIRAIKGKKLLKYKPQDLGFLIPLAFGEAPGIVMGMRVGGKVGYFLHYFMCFYRSSFGNKLCLLKSLLSNK